MRLIIPLTVSSTLTCASQLAAHAVSQLKTMLVCGLMPAWTLPPAVISTHPAPITSHSLKFTNALLTRELFLKKVMKFNTVCRLLISWRLSSDALASAIPPISLSTLTVLRWDPQLLLASTQLLRSGLQTSRLFPPSLLFQQLLFLLLLLSLLASACVPRTRNEVCTLSKRTKKL